MREKLEKYDKIIWGIILGILFLVIGFFISYFVKTYTFDISFKEFVDIAINDNVYQDRQDILILTMIPNMFLFYFVNFRWALYEMTKGLVAITMLPALGLIFISL